MGIYVWFHPSCYCDGFYCEIYHEELNLSFFGDGETKEEAYADAIVKFENAGFSSNDIHRELPSVEFLYVVLDDHYGDIITGFSNRDEAITAMKNGVKVEVMHVSNIVPTFTYSDYSMDSLGGKYLNPKYSAIGIEDDGLPF